MNNETLKFSKKDSKELIETISVKTMLFRIQSLNLTDSVCGNSRVSDNCVVEGSSIIYEPWQLTIKK